MTMNLLRGKSADAKAVATPSGGAIGETDTHVFTCPSCARPIFKGTSRCPGCGVRLIMGVIAKRAGGILALGLVFGFLIGGISTASAITLGLANPTATAGVKPSLAPAGGVATPVPQPGGQNPAAGVSQAALSGLSGTAVVNGRIAVDAATLAGTLAGSESATIDIARALRSLAADAALGIDQTGRLKVWRDAGPVMTQLDVFYRAMAETARTALRASLTDSAGYRRAGATMMAVLERLGNVDAASRALGATVGLELPPVELDASEASTTSSPGPSKAP